MSTASAASRNSDSTKKRPLEGTLKGDTLKRRNVFKHILDDPYVKVSWYVLFFLFFFCFFLVLTNA